MKKIIFALLLCTAAAPAQVQIGRNVQIGGAGSGSSGFPITLGSTAIAASSTTTAVTGLTVDGVSPTTFGFLDATSSIQGQLNAKAPQASPTFTGTVTTPALDLNGITGLTQCLHVNSSGVVSGTGSDCGSGGGGSVLLAPSLTQHIAQPDNTNFGVSATNWSANSVTSSQFANGLSCSPFNNYHGDTGGGSVNGAVGCLDLEESTNLFGWTGDISPSPEWFTYYGLIIRQTNNSAGIGTGLEIDMIKNSNQESNAISSNLTTLGNMISKADEGATGVQNKVLGGSERSGTVNTGGSGATTLVINNLFNIGPTLPILDTQGGGIANSQTLSGSTGNNTGIAIETITTPVTNISACGLVSGAINTPRLANQGKTTMTVQIALASAYLGSTTALVTLAGDTSIEIAQLATVGSYNSGTGIQTVTIPLYKPFQNVDGQTVACIGGDYQGYYEKNTTIGGEWYSIIVGTPATNTLWTTVIKAGVLSRADISNGNITLYPGAEIIGFSPNTPTGSTSTLLVTPNIASWAASDTVVVPPGLAAADRLQNNVIANNNPYAELTGVSVSFNSVPLLPRDQASYFYDTGGVDPAGLISNGGVGFAPINNFIQQVVGIGSFYRNPPSDAYYLGVTFPASLNYVQCDNFALCNTDYNLFYDHEESTSNDAWINFDRITHTFKFDAAGAAITLKHGTATICDSANAGTFCPGFTNPMSALGNILYGGASGVPTSLAGLTTAGTYNLCETPTGVSVAPTWCNSPLTKSVVASNFMTGYNATTGVFSAAQPAFTDISGTLAAAQCPLATTGAFGCVKPDGTTITISAGVITAVGSSPSFSAITSGTNTTAAMVVGSGSSLGVSGSGAIAATTAAALATTPTQCSGGTSLATGIAANGNANCAANNLPICADTSGSGTAQSCTVSGMTLGTNSCFVYTTTTANSGTGLTLNVNAGGAKPVAKWQGITTLAVGDVPANKPQVVCYDNTNIELDTVGNAPVSGPASATTTHIATFSGTSGKLLADGGFTISQLAKTASANLFSMTQIFNAGVQFTQTTGPVASSCGGGTASGADDSFAVTGISTATSCTVTFNLITASVCTANSQLSTAPVGITSISGANVILNFAATVTTLYVHCF